jgi:hypothetical protein
MFLLGAKASIGDIPPAGQSFYIRSVSTDTAQHPSHRRKRDITCDGSVMHETAEFSRCDGVMDRIASVFCAAHTARIA